MKKLSKLQINPEKVIKTEELIQLRGGFEYYCYVECVGYEEHFFGFSANCNYPWSYECASEQCEAFFTRGGFQDCHCACPEYEA
jgi:hypothetical protein